MKATKKAVVVAALFLATSCATLERINRGLDDNRAAVKAAIEKVSKIAETVSKVTGSVAGNVDEAIDGIRKGLAKTRDALDGKADDDSAWVRIVGAVGALLAYLGVRNRRSDAKKRRHNERIYGEIAHIKDRLANGGGGAGARPPAG